MDTLSCNPTSPVDKMTNWSHAVPPQKECRVSEQRQNIFHNHINGTDYV